MSDPDVQKDEQATFSETMTDAEIIDSMISGRLPKKAPNIDGFEDAIIDGRFMLVPGDALTIERWFTSGDKTYWMGTNTYSIVKVFENGDLVLSDLSNLQAAMSNWKTAPARGYRFKSSKKIDKREIRQRGKRSK